MDRLGSAKFFTMLDLRSGYWQCRIAEEDVPKTAFLTQYGLYEWVVMPMGLTNTPATFMRTMNNLFKDLLDEGVVVFLDDVLIYSYHIRRTLQTPRKSTRAPTKVRILLQAEEMQLPTTNDHLPWLRHLSRRTAD